MGKTVIIQGRQVIEENKDFNHINIKNIYYIQPLKSKHAPELYKRHVKNMILGLEPLAKRY